MIEQNEVINEVWRSISGYLNYQVSNIGRVRNMTTIKILKNTLDTGDGYYKIRLSNDGDWKGHLIHRLVAQ